MIERLLARHAPDYGVLLCGWLPLDIDTFAMDNSGTAKERVGLTYAGVSGYCPLAAYLGSHGFCLDLVLRPGTQHSAKHTDDDLRRVASCRWHTGSVLLDRRRRCWHGWTRASTPRR